MMASMRAAVQRGATHGVRLLDRWTRRPHQRPVNRVGVLLAAGMGDTLIATPMLRQLRRARPDLELIPIVNPVAAQLVALVPELRGTGSLPVGPSVRTNWRTIRQAELDVLLMPMPANTTQHSLLAWASGAPLRIKHEYPYSPERDYRFLFDELLPWRVERHRTLHDLDLLRPLGIEPDERDSTPAVVPPPEAHRWASAWLEGAGITGDFVAIHAGCGAGMAFKRWPLERFAAVVTALRDADVPVVLVGGSDERDLAEPLAALGAHDAISSGTIAQTAALLARSAVLLSNDSGLMHLATAVDRPVVALFAQGDPRHVGPYGASHVGPHHPSAMVLQGEDPLFSGLTPDRVVRAVMAQMERMALTSSVHP